MTNTKKKQSKKLKSRRQEQYAGGRFGLKTYGLIMELVALPAIAGLGAAILKPERSSNPPRPTPGEATEISLDKSKGLADASVVVVEYGDFQ